MERGIIESEGTVLAVLPERNGHQRILVYDPEKRKLLVSNNFSSGEKLKDVKKGQKVRFRGEYIPTDKGGTVHWTHYPVGYLKAAALHDSAISLPDYKKIYASYSRNPETSSANLARRLTSKWKMNDVLREDKLHEDEYNETGEDKNLIDRYIIHQIGISQPGISDEEIRKLKIQQDVLRKIWEHKHKGESFIDAFPKRLARFRQYMDIPF